LASPAPAPEFSRPVPVAAWRWGIVWLLFLATMLNYMDRLALNNTQRYLLPEFEPDPERRNEVYANVQFAFGMSFALFQVVAGFLIDRFSLRYLYLGAILVWSAAGALTGFVPPGLVAGLIACRIALGIGEAFNWPCAVACVRRVIPRESRGLANGIFHSGASIGAMATPFLVLAFVDTTTGDGWRYLFITVGMAGVLWAVFWLRETRGERAKVIDSPPAPDPGAAHDHRPFAAVFGLLPFWVCLGTGLGVNVCWHFYNQWFPRYLTEDLQVSGRTEQLVLAGFFVAADLGSMASGWTTRKLARSGFTVEASRKLVMLGLALIVCVATVPAAYLPAEYLAAKFAFFFVVAAAAMGGFAIFFSLAQDIVPRHTAKILGVCGCVSWLAISGVTMVVGGLAGPGKYAELFLVIGCVPLLAAAVGRLWPEPPRGRAGA
jgi:ACS family hexuronate transporter-like MFS transporter